MVTFKYSVGDILLYHADGRQYKVYSKRNVLESPYYLLYFSEFIGLHKQIISERELTLIKKSES